MLYQLKQAGYRLRKTPNFVATSVITLGLTLGALLSVLTLAWVLILEPLPYPEQHKLYVVEHNILDVNGEVNANAFTYPGLELLYKKQNAFEDHAMISYDEGVVTSLPDHPKLQTAFVTPGYFSLMDTTMRFGRHFELEEALDTFNPVAIISYKMWSEYTSSDKEIINQTLFIDGIGYKIIGVTEEDFIEPILTDTGLKTSIWIPFDFNNQRNARKEWGNIFGNFFYVGKLNEGTSPTQAEQFLTSILNPRWQDEVKSISFFSGWRISLKLDTLSNAILNESQQAILLLLLGVLGITIISVSNITNLFISRTTAQHYNLAIHAAAGAKRRDIFNILLAESSLITITSIILGLALTLFAISQIKFYLGDTLPRLDELQLGGSTLVFAAVIFAGLSFLLAFFSSRTINFKSLSNTLSSGGKGVGSQVSKKKRTALVAAQITVVSCLIFVNLVIIQKTLTVIFKPTGLEINDVYSLNLSQSSTVNLTQEEAASSLVQIKNSLLELPQISSVSQSSSPLEGFGIVAITEKESQQRHTPRSLAVDESYFQLLSQPFLLGDNLTDLDMRGPIRHVIINDIFANKLNPEGSPVGKQIDFGGDTATIIGVVKSVNIPGDIEPEQRIYYPSAHFSENFVIKIKAKESISKRLFIDTIKQVDSRWAVASLQSLEQRKSERLLNSVLTATTSTIVAILSFLLAAIGLYGVLNQSLQMRRSEFGTRMAIGAKHRDLYRLVFFDNSTALIIGILISFIALLITYLIYADALTSYVGYQVIPLYGVSLIAVLVLSLCSSYLPLRQYLKSPIVYSLKGSE